VPDLMLRALFFALVGAFILMIAISVAVQFKL
jgi:hypothetical protein